MALSEEDKNNIINLLKDIKPSDIGAAAVSDDENKRKWFSFGAYEGLRIASEIIDKYPVREKQEVS